MGLHSICSKAKPAWSRDLYCAYHIENEEGVKKTVFCYQIPLGSDQEMALLQKCGVSANDRMELYEHVLTCIQHQMDICSYLQARRVPSVLGFTKVEQHREDNTTYLYLETDELYPLTERMLHGLCSRTEVLDVLRQLSTVLLAISTPGIEVSHRGLDLSEVYLNTDNSIVLGGFYYACGPNQEARGIDLSEYPSYLPLAPAHLTKQLLQGGRGSCGQDMQMLAQVGWNLFSGEPHDAEQADIKTVYPAYATEAITSALLLGLSGKDEACDAFRIALLECQEALEQDQLADFPIPITVKRVKAYREEYIQP